ncbi:DUF1631 family protein [Comamonas guangdongensis]|uniref:DUF1631 family protein n=1 Tax=Comamonas guangdongensis TaxID=510515 RepID=A0ABV3ZXG0_9BURK
MSLAHASISVLRTCLVQAVRGADALVLRLIQRTEYALEQTLSAGFAAARRDVLGAALHNLQQHRSYLIGSYPQNLLEALVLSARQPFSFTAQSFDAGGAQLAPLASMAASAKRQLQAEQKLLQMVAPQLELALADLDALISGAQGLGWVQPECNPLRPENYVRALDQSLTAVQPATEVADCWREFMGQQLGSILVSEYARATGLLRQQGVQPAQYGVDPTVAGSPPQCLLTLRLLQEMASDRRWIDDSHFAVPQSLTDSMLAGLPWDAKVAPVDGLQTGWTSYSATALQTIHQPTTLSGIGMPSQAPQALAQVRTLQRMMAHMTGDARLLPAVQRVLQRLEPALQRLVGQDAGFFDDSQHPARQLLDELTARSLWFSSESALGFAHFIGVAEAAAGKLAGLPQADAQVFALALQYMREQWPPEGRASNIGVLGLGDDETSTQGLMSSALGLMDRQMVSAFGKPEPDTQRIAQIIRNLPSARGVPEDILDFVTGPWAGVIAQAQQQSADPQERDPGGYLALVPSLLWSVSAQAAQDTSRLVALAPRLQRRLARGLRSVGRSEMEIAALAARIGSLQQRVLDIAEAAARARPAQAADVLDELPSVLADLEGGAESTPLVLQDGLPVLTEVVERKPLAAEAVVAPQAVLVADAPSGEWSLGTWVELHNERQQLRTRLTWVSPQQSLFLFTAEDGSTQSMTRRMRDKLLTQGQLRRIAV